ncbi:MAG: DUF4870 domain-containing protein [Chloroflexi bacterium]|nr:MAG: DUF4870 domain-containing protein [Chloroflexota bacterium]
MSNLKETNSDDRIMSAIAHGAILLPMWGTIAAIIIWVTQKEKSEFVRQQAMQAIAWQVSQIVIMFFGMACYMCSFLTMIPFAETMETSSSGFPFFLIIPFGSMGFMMVSMLAFIVVGIVAAVRTLQGRPFTYPLIGRRIENYLAQ